MRPQNKKENFASFHCEWFLQVPVRYVVKIFFFSRPVERNRFISFEYGQRLEPVALRGV